MGGSKVPAMLARITDIITGDFTGIHRIALSDDFSAKRVMADGGYSRRIMGVAKGSVVQLFPCSNCLGIAEGVETALAAHQIFKMPVWAALSAHGVSSFPLIHAISRLVVFADNDDAGLSAAQDCGLRYSKAGVDVEIRYPPVPGSDWNDFLQMEYGNGSEA
jgi:putative DNA primase/helicase